MTAKIGDTVSMKIDPRDIPSAHGILGIAYKTGVGGGVYAVTQQGIIASNKKPFCVPLDCYGVLLPEIPTTEELKRLQAAAKQDEFVESKHGLVTLQKVH